ncbi:MAG: F0F1 ATP synthase subunit B [Ruminococcaceae bacterium]|nr:F0F1 ATP synthase subunit B [Oscillospiraceae bacterium]
MFESFIGVNFWTALFVLLNTLALFFVMKHYLYGPIMEMIEARQKEIDDMYAEADSARTEAHAMEDEYKQKLSVAVETGERIVKDATVRAHEREEEILRHANAEADAIRDKASADIAREKKKAINEAKDEISVIAVAIAQKVVGREIKESDHAALVDSFIDGLGDEA